MDGRQLGQQIRTLFQGVADRARRAMEARRPRNSAQSRFVAWAGAAAAVLAVVGIFSAFGRPPLEMPGVKPQFPEVIGFYENGWSSIFRSSFPSVRAHYKYIDTVLAFWYSIDGNGNLKANQPSPQVTSWIKSHKMQMGILVNNVAGPSGNNAGMLQSASARTRAISSLVTLVKAHGYQEVNIDFELLPSSARDQLTTFMTDLRQALPSGVRLSISVFPPKGVSYSVNGAYDYVALAQQVDYLVIMLYDHHYAGGPAGPISPYSWVSQNIDWLIKTAKIRPSKLVLAAGVYGYDWPVGSTNATELPLAAIQSLAKSQRAAVRMDAASRNPYFYYTDSSGTRHVVWFQNQTTVKQRIQLARTLKLHGVAIWALGEETPAVWSAIEQTTAAK